MRRPRSTTPLQALATLNEPLSLEAARAVASEMDRAVSESGVPVEEVIRKAFRRCTARYPESAELEVLLRLYEKEKAVLAVARTLLNLDETIVKS